MEHFNHIDIPEGTAPLWRLDERGKELSKSYREIEHGPERRAQIQHELSCIALELWCRHRDGEIEVEQT